MPLIINHLSANEAQALLEFAAHRGHVYGMLNGSADAVGRNLFNAMVRAQTLSKSNPLGLLGLGVSPDCYLAAARTALALIPRNVPDYEAAYAHAQHAIREFRRDYRNWQARQRYAARRAARGESYAPTGALSFHCV